MRRLIAVITIFTIAGFVQHCAALQADPSITLQERVDAHLETVEADLIAFRRDLHRHPELSGQEKRTAGAVAKHLKALGLEVRERVGGYGVVALLKGAKPGPIVAFRADMDAVRSNQPDPVSFASEKPGIRHICGHDIHTTVGVALAEGLHAVQDDLQGSVLFIFQPAEESVQGARAMIDDGALENPRPDAIFAYHTAPIEAGKLGSKAGIMMAARDRFTIVLKGESLEGVVNTLKADLNNLTTLEPGQTSATGDFAQVFVFNALSMTGENAWQINGGITLAGTAMRDQMQHRIAALLATLKEQGVASTFEYAETNAAGVTNDPALEKASHAPIQSVLGEGAIQTLNSVPTPFSEDFGLFQKHVPGVMYFLGVANSQKGWVGMPHTPDFVADEAAIFHGARAMAAVFIKLMEDKR
ncbi:MAG: amidohydrolase [Bacteroidota bacterium]